MFFNAKQAFASILAAIILVFGMALIELLK